MPLDPERVAECRGWLQRAWADLESARILLGSEEPRPDTALFHCQQAVEKAWKAFLFWNDVRFRKTHDLRELGEACAGLDSTLEDLADRAQDLTEFAWAFRYPGESEEPSTEYGYEALSLASEAYQAILARLPIDVRPGNRL